MHIKSIHLDGFKSYQKHTDITGFSNQFNAITGYNGSGKSNVLDSICFILGINKLDNIRAKSMAELISHGGSKATVQIRFDNRNKEHSPFGWQQFDEIVVQRTIIAQSTGKGCITNYTLNGHNVTNARIHDFFRGIGLNVNNPHFLIMQGRITTVLNMKPEEILGMVEEAAGTKMYDQKKKDAEKTMYVKEAKIREIDQIFSQSIDPRMDKFREDRKNMVEATRLTKLRDNASRKLDAYQFYLTIENEKRDSEKAEEVREEVAQVEVAIVDAREQILRKQNEKDELEKLRENTTALTELEKEYSEKRGISLKLENAKSEITDNINRHRKDHDRIGKSLEKERKLLEEKRKDLENTKAMNEQVISKHKADEEQVTQYRDDLESLTRGTVANAQGQHVSIEHEIQECRSKSAALEAGIKTARNRRDRLKPRLAQLTSEHDGLKNNNSNEIGELDKLQKTIDTMTKAIEKLGFDAAADKKLRDRAQWLKTQITNLEEANSNILDRVTNGRFQMNYTPPPIPNFDPKRDVIGYIAHYIRIKPGYEKYSQAIETACSGMLSQVIVSTMDIARVLIDSKAFSSRRTMVPISENHRNDPGRPISEFVVKNAKRKAAEFDEDVLKLIDLIDYPEYIDNTFKNFLQYILVVDSLDCAKSVAFADGVKTRVVTIRGDEVKPSGVLSGGFSEPGTSQTLIGLIPFHENKDKIAVFEDELKGLEEQIKKNNSQYQQYTDLKTQLTEAERRLAQNKNNMKNSALGVVLKDLEDTKSDMQIVEAEIEKNSKQLSELQEKVKTLETMKNNDKNSQEKRKKELTALLQKAEKNATQNKDKAEKARRTVMQITAAVEDLAQSIRNDEAEWENAKRLADEQEELYPAAEAAFQEAKAETDNAQQKLNDYKNEQRQVSSRHTKANKDLEVYQKEESKLIKRKNELEAEIVRLHESAKSNRKAGEDIVKRSEWLLDEQVHFNKKDGPYNFDGYSQNKGTLEIKEFTDKITKLERSLCMKNVSNLDTCEARVIDIKSKRARLEDDYQMLKKTIAVLDKRKIDELIRAHESVNNDFGKIFNCLLPDANAELVAPEGKTVYEGLEVRVSFNGVVKESLHELSGGQRSLVALSLILAMLKFKPAPLYILDEVDAALDLSHTANIGMMIKLHFQHSQFVIVSLKQGMFSNADVIFQTHFADGHSTCTRLTGAALEKIKCDKKLAAQATELSDQQTESKKTKKKGNNVQAIDVN